MKNIKKFLKFVKTSILYLWRRNKYKKVDFFQYEKLAKSNIVIPYGLISVFLYGNYKAVAQLKGSVFNFWNEYLEHGVAYIESLDSISFGGYADRKTIKKIYTYSENRKQVILKYLAHNGFKKEVIALGPYIKGSSHFYSIDELQNLKAKYGKILLVFPMHSIPGAKAQYDHVAFMNAIKEVSSYFDNVFVCMYWHDILEDNSLIEEYEKQGYIIVCNGHKGDPKFLNRQKDLIYLSDMVMTNALGTYMGYAICMQKPLYFYTQKIFYKLDTDPSLEAMSSEKKLLIEYARLFGNFSFDITEEQITMIKKYWGEWKD